MNTLRELLEVSLLRGAQRKAFEERDDRLEEINSSSHDVSMHMFAMVVGSSIDDDLSNAEELFELAETVDAACALRHRELMRDLPAGSVANSRPAAGLADEPNREASFSVYKTNNPAKSDQPFLLIFRTRHIVTVDVRSDVTSSAGYSDLPAYGQMRTASLPMRGAAFPTLGPFTVVTPSAQLRTKGADSFLVSSHGRP